MAIESTLSGVVAGLCAGLIGMALMRVPSGRVTAPLRLLVFAGTLWIVGDVLADAAPTLAWKQLAIAITYTGAISLPALWWIVVLRWAEDVEPTRPPAPTPWVGVPLVWAGLMWILMVTNPWHEAFLTPVVGGRNLYGPLWYAAALPSYGLGLGALAVEFGVWRRVERVGVGRQAAMLVAASLVALGGNLFYVAGLSPFNPTVASLSLAGALLIVGIARDGLFGAVSAALPTIADHHPDGVVVTGPDGHIQFANSRAEELMSPIALRRDVSFARLLRDSRLRPDSVLDLEHATEQTWWNALAGLHGLPFQLDTDRPRRLHVRAAPLWGRRGRVRGFWLRISDQIVEDGSR